jgi:hypothetical protein
MNNLKKISIALLVLLLSSTFIYSQDIGQGEFMIVNQTNSTPITVKIYPVGAIFNGADQYTVVAEHQISQTNKYIFGMEIPISYDQNGTEWYKRANFDKSQYYTNCQFSLGYGRYRIDFYEGTTKTNSCDVDFSDANFTGQDVSGYIQHLRIDYYSSSEIIFQFINPNSENVNIADVNNYIKVWEQVGTENTALTPSKGNFTDSQDPASQYHAFPLDATAFGHFAHVTPEEVKLNLKLSNYNANLITDKSITFSSCEFKVETGKTFSVHSNQYAMYPLTIAGQNGKFISGSSTIVLDPYVPIHIENYAVIEANGTTFQSSSTEFDCWGIILDDPGASTIQNCIFNKNVTAISSTNSGNNWLKILNNTFNIPDDDIRVGLHIEHTYKLLVQGNTFNLPGYNANDNNTAIQIKNGANSESDNNSNGPGSPLYQL